MFGIFFCEELVEFFSVDFWIGLLESEELCVVLMIFWWFDLDVEFIFFQRVIFENLQSLQVMVFLNIGGFDFNLQVCYVVEIGGGGGVLNVCGFVCFYVFFVNDGCLLDGQEFIDVEMCVCMVWVFMVIYEDVMLLLLFCFVLGFMKMMDNWVCKNGLMDFVVFFDVVFGYVGVGGLIGFVDFGVQFSFGYVMNCMGEGILFNECGQLFVDVVYCCFGYESNVSGVWMC